MTIKTHYFVTDIETDGPAPSENSMLSFATVAVRNDGEISEEFEAVLEPIDDRKPDPKTLAWWHTQPEAWAATTLNPRNPKEVMNTFADWVEDFEGDRIFAARPLIFDGGWMDTYLHKFAKSRVCDGPYSGRHIFNGGGLDIPSFIAGLFANMKHVDNGVRIPDDWLGFNEHTHRAIDDARGYANLLSRLLKIVAGTQTHPDDFFTGVTT
ncbi:MAG: 3'-5' exoribonuclease [Rhizobiaceae bacterium]|nr:3'-5' exoribonuclease [Rhizobiaceae bacterium]